MSESQRLSAEDLAELRRIHNLSASGYREWLHRTNAGRMNRQEIEQTITRAADDIVKLFDHIDALDQDLDAVRAESDTWRGEAAEALAVADGTQHVLSLREAEIERLQKAPIEFDLRDLIVILDCLDADIRSPWLIGASELSADRHRIAEILRSTINDANVSNVRAVYTKEIDND